MITKFKIYENFGIELDTEKSEVGVKVLQMLSQIQMFHWQVDKIGHHKTFDEFNEEFKNIADELIEVIQGKYGRIILNPETYIPLRNIQELDPYGFAEQCIEVFKNYKYNFFEKDEEIGTLIDEVIAKLQKLKYLLTFVG